MNILSTTLSTICIVITCLVLSSATAMTQDIIDASSADLDDFMTSFKNPASISFLPNQLIFGTKAYEVGVNSSFFDISHGYIGYYSPYWRKRIGVFGEFLRTGIFNTTDIGVSYSERLGGIIAVGGRFDIVNQGFDQGQFQGVDPGDPVLSEGLSKNYVSITAGAIAVPIPELSIGAVVKNINKPNVAIDRDNPFRLPLRYDLGIQYRAGRVHPSVNVGVEDGTVRFRLRFGVAVWDDIWARFDYQRDNLGFEGQMRFYKGLHFNYRYQYPLNELSAFSKGSHALAIVYDFTKILEIPVLPDIQYQPEPVELESTGGEIPIEGDFCILSSLNQMEIWEKNITRKVDADVPMEFIRRNYKKIFDDLRDDVLREDTGGITFYPDTLEGLVGSYSRNYISSLDSISGYLWETDSTETRIYARDEDVFRAENIRGVIANKSQTTGDRISLHKLGTPSSEMEAAGTVSWNERDLSLLNNTESLTVLSEERVVFDILALNQNLYSKKWSLLIEDTEKNAVKTFSGVGDVPPRIEWDWYDQNGELIEPGWYSYLFRWEDNEGRQKESSPGKIHVKKNKKDILIELTKKKLKGKKAQRLELHLDQ